MNRYAFTPGEPAGIGPDLAVMLAQSELAANAVIYADPDLLIQRAILLGKPLHIRTRDDSSDWHPGLLTVEPVELDHQIVIPGELNPLNSHYVLRTLDKAHEDITAGLCNALVTGPVNKMVINQADIAFTGHTEYLAALNGKDKVVMMLAAPWPKPLQPLYTSTELRVALVTTHLSVANVPAAITINEVVQTLTIVVNALRSSYHIEQPVVAVSGLNPHAGEGGHLGMEEIDIITPALQQCAYLPATILGPLPADTIFQQSILNQADVIISMYHDQGLPVLKFVGFGQAVNVTLGLPYLRTSVDHGTALDLAGKGLCSMDSLLYAITTVQRLEQ